MITFPATFTIVHKNGQVWDRSLPLGGGWRSGNSSPSCFFPSLAEAAAVLVREYDPATHSCWIYLCDAGLDKAPEVSP